MSPVDLTHPDRHKNPEMTAAEMKAIRHKLGLSTTQLGRAFGYSGADDTASMSIRRYESTAEKTSRTIPNYLARLLRMYERYGIPPEWLERPKD